MAHSKQSPSCTRPHGLSARQRSISADMEGAPTGRFSSLIGVPPDYGRTRAPTLHVGYRVPKWSESLRFCNSR